MGASGRRPPVAVPPPCPSEGAPQRVAAISAATRYARTALFRARRATGIAAACHLSRGRIVCGHTPCSDRGVPRSSFGVQLPSARPGRVAPCPRRALPDTCQTSVARTRQACRGEADGFEAAEFHFGGDLV